MLDVLLANTLVKAIAPGAHLLFVGDVDQLPSVGVGEVLRDLLTQMSERIDGQPYRSPWGSLLAAATNVLRFFRDESCGQCVPCRVGTKRQEEVLERIAADVRQTVMAEQRHDLVHRPAAHERELVRDCG